MIKIVGCIVSTKFSIAGFLVRGKTKEFGGCTDDEIVLALDIKQMAAQKFGNNQIKVLANNQVVEQGNFKINELPMQMIEDGALKPIDNKISLLASVHKDGECLGYDVVIGGLNKRLTTKSICQLSRYFKPSNFMCRVNSNGTEFLSGTNGTKLGELPVVELGAPVNVGKSSVTTEKRAEKKKAANEHGVAIPKIKEEKMAPNCSLIGIYSFLQTVCGYLAIFTDAGHSYTATLESRTEYDDNFTAVGLVELAKVDGTSYTFNRTELNVSATFKKPGLVRIPSGQVISTYVITNKKLINNGKNNMKHIGIAIPKSASNALKGIVADPYRLKEITDNKISKTLETLYNVSGLDIYDLDIEDMPVVMEEEFNRYMLCSDMIDSTVKKQTAYALACKALKPGTGLIADLKKEIGYRDTASALGYKINPMFSAFSEDVLMEIRDCGIDLFSGAFTKTQANESYGSGSSGAGGSAEKVIPIAIDYYLKGYELKVWTYKKIMEELKTENSKLEFVRELIGNVLSIADPREQLVAANEVYEKLNTVLEVVNKNLWLHKYCMYKKFNGVHATDALDWIPVSSKKKNALVYENEKHNGLYLDITGIEMINK